MAYLGNKQRRVPQAMGSGEEPPKFAAAVPKIVAIAAKLKDYDGFWIVLTATVGSGGRNRWVCSAGLENGDDSTQSKWQSNCIATNGIVGPCKTRTIARR